MYYRMTVAGLERDLPICPVNDKLYIAGFVIFGDQELTVACASSSNFAGVNWTSAEMSELPSQEYTRSTISHSCPGSR